MDSDLTTLGPPPASTVITIGRNLSDEWLVYYGIDEHDRVVPAESGGYIIIGDRIQAERRAERIADALGLELVLP